MDHREYNYMSKSAELLNLESLQRTGRRLQSASPFRGFTREVFAYVEVRDGSPGEVLLHIVRNPDDGRILAALNSVFELDHEDQQEVDDELYRRATTLDDCREFPMDDYLPQEATT